MPLVYLVPQKTLKSKQAAHQVVGPSLGSKDTRAGSISRPKGKDCRSARGPRNWLEEDWTPEKKTLEKRTSGRQYLPWLKEYLICFSVGTVFGEPLSSAQWGPVCGQAGPETFSLAR